MNRFFACTRMLTAALLLSGGMLGAFAAAEPSPSPSPADSAWKALQKAGTPPNFPKEWFTHHPTEEQMEAFNKERRAKALSAADLAKRFYTDFPDDKHAGDARMQEYHLLTAVFQLGDSSVKDRIVALQQKLADDPTIDKSERVGMILMAGQSMLQGASDDPVPALLKAKDAFMKAHQLSPESVEPSAYLLQLADMLLIYDQIDAAREIIKQLDVEGTDPDIRKEAQTQLAKFDRVGKPVEISFTAIDGRKVDLADLKGKVVMIDYWATWCGPCVGSIPEVLETYHKWHPKGFEIVGISLDNDEDALKKMVKEKEMPWPQFFDKENDNNRYAEKYGITGIPTVWLVDKQGKLRYLNARHDLDGKVAKLMAEE